MYLKRILILLFLLISISIYTNEKQVQNERSLSVAYFGELLTHPGLKISLELPFYTNNSNEYFAIIKGGGYFHYLNHTSIFVGSEFGYRHYFKNGFDFHSLIGIGYMHKILGATIYEVSGSGELLEIPNYGSSHLMPNIEIGFGYIIARDSDNPINIYSRTEIFGEYPYNTYILPHLATSIGLRINL